MPHTFSSLLYRRNPDAWSDPEAALDPYSFTLPVASDPELVSSLAREAGGIMGHGNVVRGLNATADSFYSSQVGHYYESWATGSCGGFNGLC